MYIIGNQGIDKGLCVDLDNQDYTFLLTGGHYRNNNQFVTDDNILLEGELSNLQPLLSDDVLDLKHLDDWDYNKEFFKMMNYKKISTFDYKDIKLMCDENIVHLDNQFEKKLERSAQVLKLVNKAKRR